MIQRNGRLANELREIKIIPDYIIHPEGSVLIEIGQTKIICTATVEEKIPPFLKGTGQGWITAEYGMLPRSTETRMRRESGLGKQSGRTQEIQRLIGRSLRQAVNLKKLGERQIIIDCDVIQADGGTRTASITGGYVALAIAVKKLIAKNLLTNSPIIEPIAAISVGIVDGELLLDLDYVEDSGCDSDVNIVLSQSRKIIEIQGTAEGNGFSIEELVQLNKFASESMTILFKKQEEAIFKAK